MKKLLGLIIFLVMFALFPRISYAAQEFKTDYDVNYDVGNDGITQTTEKITLTNLTETYFASTFVLTIGSTALTDVTATDEGGAMDTKVDVSGNKTNVNLKFNEQITGINKEQTLTLKYKSNDFAEKIGKIWEVNLPRIHEGSDVNNFNLNLSVPFSFGEPTSITPKPKSESDRAGKLTFNFAKEQLANSGVSVNFGSNQVFDFNLKYTLSNNSFLPVVSSISLPMDTNYQDVSILSINPKPLNVTTDPDGNYLAWYQVPKRSNLEISVNGSARLYINPKKESLKLSKSEISNLTKSDKFWEKDSPSIKAVISEIFKNSQPKSTKEKIKLIYQYVVTTLKYSSTKPSDQQRLGALTVLSNTDKAQAQEFTDLFITLARAAGISARELDGFAYTQNKNLRPLSLTPDITTVWPEYFDETAGWVMVDPTWENTTGGVDYFNKLDLNHLILNIRGNSSTQPIPTTSANVSVSSTGDFNPVLKPDVEINVSDKLWAGLPGTITIKILNNGSSSIDANNLNVVASVLNIIDPKNIQVSSIPPFGFAEFTVYFRTPFLSKDTTDNIVINYLGQIFQKQVTIRPFFLVQLFPYIFVLTAFIIFGIYFFVLGIHIHKKSPDGIFHRGSRTNEIRRERGQ